MLVAIATVIQISRIIKRARFPDIDFALKDLKIWSMFESFLGKGKIGSHMRKRLGVGRRIGFPQRAGWRIG